MGKIVDYLKSIWWVFGCIVAVIVFFHKLTTLEPRMIKMEERQADTDSRLTDCEKRVSMFEVKLDTLIEQGAETHKDVKDIYLLILERHK